MKKTSLVISGVTVIVLSLAGCGGGGGSSSSPTTSSKTGTGYYIDNAVAGVNYTCGSQKGTTDKDGKFTFEKGKECTFEVAGITLRKVPADNLADNAKVVENNVTVARFLQSIDTDGNLSNGIQITNETITILTKALQQENIKTVPDTTTKLDTVVSHIEQEDTNFKGHVVTEEEAQNHLKATQKTVIKDMLAGKTFYGVGYGNDGWHAAGSIEFNKELTIMHYKGIWYDPNDDETDSIKVESNKLVWLSDNSYSIVGANKGDYIELTDYNADSSLDSTVPVRLYFDKTKAEGYFNSLKGTVNNNNNNNDSNNHDSEKVSDLISGHINFIDVNGNSISAPANAWIRITPQENQTEGNWNGVNCKLDANGNFGAECYVHTNVGSMRKYFNSDYSNTYQFIPYIEKTGDTRFEREEEGFGRLNKTDGTDPFAMHYGDWENATVIVNNS